MRTVTVLTEMKLAGSIDIEVPDNIPDDRIEQYVADHMDREDDAWDTYRMETECTDWHIAGKTIQ